jgi:DNA-binding NarL/FixJ family response regulator
MRRTKSQKNDPVNAKVKATVLLVDDHPIVRQGVAQLINREPDFMVCGEADTAHAALTLLTTLKPDLAIIDLSLEDRNGMDLLKDMKARSPKLHVLVLSMHDESVYAERALRAGAKGYIMKQEAPDRVLVALRTILAGEVYVSEKMAAQMLRALSDWRPGTAESPVERLSDRELEVFRLIGKGLSTSAIAEQLFISVKTVETHREHIKIKLKLTKKGDLLQQSIQWCAENR